MKRLFPFVFTFFFVTLTVQSQELKVNLYNPPIPHNGYAEWGPDYVVTNSEPFGRPSGAYRNSNSTIYTSIPDTNITPGANEGLVILISSNDGANWSRHTRSKSRNCHSKN